MTTTFESGGAKAGVGASIRAAILDLDGTLVHTLGDFVEALQRMLRDLPAPYTHFSISAASIEPLVGKGSENLIKSLLAQIDTAQGAIKNEADMALFDLACARYLHHYADVNGRFSTVYPGVLEGLVALQALGWPLACVTNKPTAFAQTLLRATGLERFFAFTLGGDALPRKKPDPLPLLTACERLGVPAAQTLMVGDSSNDAQAARAAGCPVWLMTYGYNHGQSVHAVDADGFVDRLVDLPWLTSPDSRARAN